jgi:hypothetical protein
MPMAIAQGKPLPVGALARVTATAFIGQFLANQIVNFLTRGKPTWDNEEETPGAKISAWVPDWVSGGPGFFLNPMTLPLEITHLLHKGAERGGGDYLGAFRQFMSGRLNVIGRPIFTFIREKDVFGRSIPGPKALMKEMGASMIPAPLGISPIYRGIKQQISGENEERFAGQFQGQMMQSVGLKPDKAPNAEQRIRILAQEFKEKQPGYSRKGDFFGSDYGDFKNALSRGNTRDARIALEELRRKKDSDNEIKNYLLSFPHRAFTGRVSWEGQFRRGLTPAQRAVYDQAITDRKRIRDLGLKLIRDNPRAK